jgi:hypothetical protein
MEAVVAEKEVEMTEWNDGRLDELSKRVDDGFIGVNQRIDHLSTRFDALQRVLMQVGGGIFVALIGLIATQV